MTRGASCTHVLAEFDCLDPLLSALRLDLGRIKCTCLSVSRKWLALGTSAGGLHLIQRDGWKQKLILTHKEGSVTQVSCCPHDEDFIAVATSQGLVVVWELHLERRGRPERVSVSWEHRGQTVTSLCWDNAALRVFAGDVGGKVSCVRAGSSKLGKGSAFVIFPIQTITTVDSRVVQLGYSDGHLVVSSLSRCYLCDTEREKFWRVGNKERDGEFGACFLQQSPAGQRGQALLYCARPGSRIWEASFGGEVLSTHQFKQLLACPPLPLVSYNPAQTSPQSLAFPRLLHDQNLLTWTDSAIYIFTPHSGQVLLWTEVKDVVEISVFRNELFCLHGDGRLSHLSLMSPERCVERLMKRENWTLATTICCMFQHTVITSRARKSLPIDRLEQLKAQLNSASQEQLIGQLEEVISKLEPLDSACSSRRSSISSHVSPKTHRHMYRSEVALTKIIIKLANISPLLQISRFYFFFFQDSGLSYCISVHINSPNILRRVVEFTQASKVVEVIQKGDLLKSLRSLRELQPWNTPLLLSHLYRLYDKHGEVAVRAYPQFYPTILPSDIMAMALPSHFLPYLDNLVQSRVEQQRLCFLGSLLQPETLRQDWLELALYNDAPQKDDTLTADGQPRWHSHFFSWGYGRLLSLLIRLPADLASKQKMLEKCRTHGYWMGYLYLCRELQRRPEAFSAICRLDDMTLLEGDDGIVPQSFDEWVLLLQLSQQISSSNEAPPTSALPNGSTDWSIRVSPENIILRLVRVFGPDRALTALQERGIQVDLSSRSTLVCDLLRMAEKRHRALIQTMLERCDRFLWSQQA
uniref:Hermansky-Pudlak syndrome 5 protein homolog n=1 Tax=Sinocyclocheilus grahami TaxID=75366 RepID=A0A672N3W9_SINGR